MKKKLHKSPPSASQQAQRDRVLDAVLADVVFDGWTQTAFANGVKRLELTQAEAGNLFPGGLSDVIELFGDRADAAMQKRIENERGFERFRVRDKIAFALRARFEALAPHREAARRLMFWYALPHHAPAGIRRIAKTVDGIWIAAGDTSTDYNFYTKRFLLAGVLKATTLYWLNDDSPGHAATWDFLDRRIGDVMKFGKSISLLKEFKPSEIVDMVRDKIKKAI
jgi:ubiquinone biosynthesis protein COQ9